MIESGKTEKEVPSSEKFFALQILENEGTANMLVRAHSEKSEGQGNSKEKLVILIADSSRIKFGYGVREAMY